MRLGLVLALVVPLGLGSNPVHGQSEGEGLEVIGPLPIPADVDDPKVLALTSNPHRLYLRYERRLNPSIAFVREYDATKDIPVATDSEWNLGSASELGSTSPYLTAHDPDRGRLLLLSLADATSTIRVLDLTAPGQVEVWDLTQQVPGFRANGIVYDDGRVYVVGEMQRPGSLNVVVASVTAVVALDAEDGSREWVRVVPECRTLADVHNTGTLITSSDHRPELSFFCRHLGSSQSQFASQQGQPGLVQVQIEAHDAAQTDAARFEVQFHPVAGTYVTGSGGAGVAAFDPTSDRFFVQSLSRSTPGAWVFDGVLDRWVGFLAAPPGGDFGAPEYNGFSPVTGHFYMASKSEGCEEPTGRCGYIRVVDGRTTPVPQGEETTHDIATPLVADPVRPRMFAQATGDTGDGWVVLEDHVSSIEVLEPVGYDARTDDVPESEDTLTFHSAGTAGFGSQVTLVGGVESAATRSETLEGPESVLADLRKNSRVEALIELLEGAGVDSTVPETSFGNRQVRLGAVEDASLSIAGSTATAQAVERDNATVSDTEQVRRRAGVDDERLCQDDRGDDSQCEEAWPYALATCSDGTREPEQASSGDDAEVGNANVACDLEAEKTVASARYGDLPIGDMVSVASSTTDTSLVRIPLEDPAGANAAVVETVAVAEGIELRAPDGAPDGAGGSASIAEVRAVARAEAGGRIGTAEARWTRTLRGVVVRDAGGEVVFGPASCVTIVDGRDDTGNGGREVNSCEQAISAINSVLQTRMRVELPTASVVATPKGAFAAVQQTDGDQLGDQTTRDEPETETAVPALDIAIFNDRAEKSRLVVQLAGVRANSIYTITHFPSSDTGTDTGSETPTDDGTVGSSAPAPPALPPTTSATTTGAAPPSASAPPVTVGPPEQAVSIDLAASQDDPQQPQVSPRQATSLPGRIGAGMQLLTRHPVQALMVGGVWLLFAGALTTLLRRLRLRQVVSS